MRQAWNRIDVAALSVPPETETVRGVTVAVQISPYDRPLAFRGFHVPEEGVFRIEFKYCDDEPCGPTRPIDKLVSVRLGMHSEKLLSIDIAVDSFDLQRVTLWIERADAAVRQLRETVTRPSARLNYGAVDRVLASGCNRDALVASTN